MVTYRRPYFFARCGIAGSAALLVSSAAGVGATAPQSPEADGDPSRDRLIDQLIVMPVDTATDGELALEVTAEVPDGAAVIADEGAFSVLSLAEPVELQEAELLAAELIGSGLVADAEPDGWRYAASPPDDTFFPDQWALGEVTANNIGIGVETAWDITRELPGVTVAVLDSGVVAHPDLIDQLTGGYDFVSSLWMANDGDGKDADPSDPGDPCDGKPSTWHGLHTAGIAGATADNAIGIAGIGRQATIQPVRVLGVCGGRTSDLASGIRWAAGLAVPGVPTNPTPARVINLSLGGVSHCSSAEQSAIDAAVDKGAVIVAAAGNRNRDILDEPYAPANCDQVITVAATTKTGARAAYSNYGSLIDISAPGGGPSPDASERRIISLSNAGLDAPDLSAGGHTYSYKQGTSMAAAAVSGVVALMLAANSALDWAEVIELLQASATPFPVAPEGPNRTCSSDLDATFYCGAGIVDAGAAVLAAEQRVTVPGLPSAVTGIGTGLDRAIVSWSPPDDGGSMITEYVATVTPGGGSCTWASGPLRCEIVGLATGQEYSVSVAARNRKGEGARATSPLFGLSPTFGVVGPGRLFDTRLGVGGVGVGRVVPGSVLEFGVLGVGGVPGVGVGAVSLNVTVTGGLGDGFLTVFGCGGSVPWVSSVNFGVGESVANAVLVPPGVGGRVCFDASVGVHVIADVNGWFADASG